MLKKERQQHILHLLRQKNKVVSSELSSELSVSEDTIRRDLKELSNDGQVLKVHGGALSTAQHLYTYREDEIFDHEKKLRIANKAMNLIQDHRVIIMSGGTTNLELARIFPKDLDATIFTYSLPIAMQLTEHPRVEIIFLGGKILKEAQVTIGFDVVNALSDIRADLCFLGTSGLDLKTGLTEINWEVSHVKKVMISASDKVVSLATLDKIDTVQRYFVSELDKISSLVTEANPEDPILGPYRKKGLEIL